MATFYAVGSGDLDKDAASWDAAHDAATADAAWDGYVYIFADPTGIDRSGISFEVSSVSILSASIFLSGQGLNTEDGHFDVILVSGADLADTLVKADYGELLDDVTSYGSINSANVALEAWNEIPLNAAGLAALTASLASGRFRVGVRHSKDVNDTIPSTQSYAQFYAHGDVNKPKLVIVAGSPYSQAYIIG